MFTVPSGTDVVGGGKVALDDPTIGVENGRLFFVLGNGLPPVRTPSEVLSIVYAGGTSGGGFVPRGVNGTIDSV